MNLRIKIICLTLSLCASSMLHPVHNQPSAAAPSTFWWKVTAAAGITGSAVFGILYYREKKKSHVSLAKILPAQQRLIAQPTRNVEPVCCTMLHNGSCNNRVQYSFCKDHMPKTQTCSASNSGMAYGMTCGQVAAVYLCNEHSTCPREEGEWTNDATSYKVHRCGKPIHIGTCLKHLGW